MKPFIVANWKLYVNSADEAERLFTSVEKGIQGVRGPTVVMCPPFVFLHHIQELMRHMKSRSVLGAQDVFWENGGQGTGETTPLMLEDAGVRYVIVGHSERRLHLGETNEMVAKKILAALKARLTPILCVGERERTDGWADFIAEQVRSALAGVPVTRLKDIIIAYEPVWAVWAAGTGDPDTPEDALTSVILIRKTIGKMFSVKRAHAVPVLYGGSATSSNAGPFVATQGIDGLLVGHASADAEEFIRIVEIAAERCRTKSAKKR